MKVVIQTILNVESKKKPSHNEAVWLSYFFLSINVQI